MTQSQLVIAYIQEHGSITPAREHGFPYKDGFIGSEASKRCRELRTAGVLKSERSGKFERFYLTTLAKEMCPKCHVWLSHSKDCPLVAVKEKQTLF